MNIKRIQELYTYNPSKGIIKETYGDVDTSGYICIGEVPSNGGLYTYYCLIKKGDLYDLETNEERLSLEQAMKKYPYVGQNWQDEENVIVVNTYQPTPIWCILDTQTGKWYDKDWNEIQKPF